MLSKVYMGFWYVDQAKVAYEIPLSARDREDDNLFKDFEDQLSDDSSGNYIIQHLWLLHYEYVRALIVASMKHVHMQ